MNETNRPDAWNVLFVAKVNVCYWKSLIELYEKWRRCAQYVASGIGLIAAIIVYIANRNGVTTVVTAISAFLIAVIGGPYVNRERTSEAKWGHRRWSELCSEAEALWRHGEERGWGDSDMTARTAALVEREKQYHAHEYHNEKALVLSDCEARVQSDMATAYCTEER